MRNLTCGIRLATLLTVVAIGGRTGWAQGIEPFQSQEVKPNAGSDASRQKAAPGVAAQKPSAPAPIRVVTLAAPLANPATAGNLVEPLSNGLQLTWTSREIKKAFGAGTPSWDSRTITYPSFRVAVGGREETIWHLHLTGREASLSSGIHPGSTKADVQIVFGGTDRVKHDQYELTFQYDGEVVVDIGVDPAAGEFKPYVKETTAPQKAAPAVAILGQWWGVQSMTQIDIKADGSYTSPNGAKGTWRKTGDDLVFTGPLAGWNGGRAKLTQGGWIEFLWKDQSGAAYLFQLVRR